MAVYLDNNATTVLDENVLEAMLPYMGQVTGNPSSVHRFGRLQKDAIEMFNAVTIFAEKAERLPNTVQFGVDGFDGETLLMQLDRKAIAVSSGSACTSGKTEPSHVLKAMKVPDGLANSAVRVSFSKTNTMSDVNALLTALNDIIEINRHSAVMMAANV